MALAVNTEGLFSDRMAFTAPTKAL